MLAILRSLLFATLLVMVVPAIAGEQYKVTESNSLLYKVGTIFNVENWITLKRNESFTVTHTKHKSCVETLKGPYSDTNVTKHGITFLKSIKCLASQRGGNNDAYHFCFKPPINALSLYRHHAEITEKLVFPDTGWWDYWEAGEHTFSWPVDTLPIEDNSHYQANIGEIQYNLYFHQLPTGLSNSEQRILMRSQLCLHQFNGHFTLDNP